MRLELFIALRYLQSRRGSQLLSLSSLITIGGVTVAVSALIVTLGVMSGLQTDLREKILIASPDIRVEAYGEDNIMTDWRPVIEKVRRQKGVVAVAPFVFTQAVVRASTHKHVEPVVIEGIPPEGDITSIRRHATAGDFSFATRDGQYRGAVLGSKLAERLNLTPGRDSIQVFTASTAIDPITGWMRPSVQTFEVTGIFETGLYEYDNSYVVTSLAAAQQFAQLGDAVTGLEVKTPTRDEAPAIGRQIADSLGPTTYRAVDWQEQNGPLFHALKLEKLGMTLVLFLIVLVSAFNIVNTLIMIVTDKTREIGILRAMGMSANSIRGVFFTQGVAIGVIGTSAGLVLGLVASLLIGTKKLIPLDPTVYFIDHLPVSTQGGDVALIAVASLVIAALATIYPARQATRLFPVDAIRHD